ncbi:unnamed protein product [Effrenium voratum]|nr:unnamed protein product [Effrenium voratum]
MFRLACAWALAGAVALDEESELFLIQVGVQAFSGPGAVRNLVSGVQAFNASSAVRNIVSTIRDDVHKVEENIRRRLTGDQSGNASERDSSAVSKAEAPKKPGQKQTQPAQAGSQIYQDQLGLKKNSAADVEALRTAFVFNMGLICAYLFSFALLQHFQPIVYLNNSRTGRAPEPRPSWYGCWLSSAEVQEYAGLDSALLVDFCNLGMKICFCLGLPISAVLIPIYFSLGTHYSDCGQSGAIVGPRSSLDLLSIASLGCNQSVRWLLAFSVWICVWAVQRLLWEAQKSFVQRRIAWLQQRPKPQSSTVLVANIPPRHRSDAKLKNYFQRLFPENVETVYVVKQLSSLAELLEEYDTAEQRLHEALYQWQLHNQEADQRPKLILDKDADPVDSIEHYTRLMEHLQRLIETERARIRSADNFTQESLCSSSAFVTFKSSRDAEMALRLRLEPEGHVFTMEYAPAPKDVAYDDLLGSPQRRQLWHFLGFVMIIGVFLFWFPLIGLASSIVNLENLEQIQVVHQILTTSPWLQSLLEGIFATLLLSLFMGFLPSALSAIISSTFTFTSKAESQLELQQWYYWFQVIFVLLVTAVGTSLWQRFNDVLASPKGVLFDLANSLPNTSTFYMSYVILNWSLSVLNALRYQNIIKFLAWNAVCEEDRAKAKSEPEDPDYYGIGSRSARLSLIMAIGLVFSLLSPLTLWVVFAFFFINRLVFSYLVVFAETQKQDMGGKFWALQLRHVHLALPIFVAVMSGCIWTEPYGGPGMLALLSLMLWGYEYSRWSDILWETLPFRAVVEGAESGLAASEESYVQSELTRDLRAAPALKAG